MRRATHRGRRRRDGLWKRSWSSEENKSRDRRLSVGPEGDRKGKPGGERLSQRILSSTLGAMLASHHLCQGRPGLRSNMARIKLPEYPHMLISMTIGRPSRWMDL